MGMLIWPTAMDVVTDIPFLASRIFSFYFMTIQDVGIEQGGRTKVQVSHGGNWWSPKQNTCITNQIKSYGLIK